MHWKWTKALLDNEFMDGPSYKNLVRWANEIAERPAVKRGQRVLGFGEDGLKERHSKADFD
jgi:GST-like protein